MNRRQWKKACKRAAAECASRWPGEYNFVPADGMDTVYGPTNYNPPYSDRSERNYPCPPVGTPLLVTVDYWGECNIETALQVFEARRFDEEFDWEAACAASKSPLNQLPKDQP